MVNTNPAGIVLSPCIDKVLLLVLVNLAQDDTFFSQSETDVTSLACSDRAYSKSGYGSVGESAGDVF